jgi:hypothetical protein
MESAAAAWSRWSTRVVESVSMVWSRWSTHAMESAHGGVDVKVVQ